jgi:hypothetical protein
MTDEVSCCGACGHPLHTTKEADRIEQLVAINEALTEQLEAARADAKEAEAYAEELEKRVAFVEGGRRKTLQALLKVTKIHDEVESKLAKAVEALGIIKDRQFYRMGPGITAQVIARTTLAEIEGSDAP